MYSDYSALQVSNAELIKKMFPKKGKLLVITGASGVGKSSVYRGLLAKATAQTDYVVLESDLLWNEDTIQLYDGTEENRRKYWDLWLLIAITLVQMERPVVLEGYVQPEWLEQSIYRDHFSRIQYLSLICTEDQLRYNLQVNRGITSTDWLESAVTANRWMLENASCTNTSMTLLDSSGLDLPDTQAQVEAWIMHCLVE